MIARKLVSLLVSTGIFFIVFPKVLGISVSDLIPEEARYLAFGLLMVIGGYFAHQDHEATLKVSLLHTNVDPYDIRSVIDQHLKARDMEVVAR